MVRPAGEVVHCAASGQPAQAVAERGDTATAFDRPDRHTHLPGAGDGIRGQVDGEAVLGEPPAQRGRRLHLGHNPRARILQPGQQRASAVGSIAVDRQLLRGNAFGDALDVTSIAVRGRIALTHILAAGGVAVVVSVLFISSIKLRVASQDLRPFTVR